MASLELFLHDRFVGVVEADRRDRSRVVLAVDGGYSDGGVLLSEGFATLPGRRPALDAVANFLGGYVPEGKHRKQMAAKRRVSKDDLFALLNEFGGSIAGAVTLRRPDEMSTTSPGYEALSDRALEAKLMQAINDSDQGVADDSRSTLAGYQPKVLVAGLDGGWTYPHGRAHSTHILKPRVPARPTRIFDEHYSHLLSRRIGLSDYGSEMAKAGRTTYLAIERFDREIVDGTVRLHHQEDLAQALGLDWRDTDVKFQEPGWPGDPTRATAQRIGELLGSIPGGDEAVEEWLRHLAFHLAIGNNDAHAKNVALMHRAAGTTLAPVYDAVPNLFQAGLIKWDLALAIGGVFDHRRMSVERVVDEARSWGVLSEHRAEVVVGETLAALGAALAAVEPPKGISAGMVERLQWNVRRLLAGSEISKPR